MTVIVTKGTDPYAILMSGNNTIGVLGCISSQIDRDNPPQPYNGFDTSLTPFGNGHVFAFQMGGCDDRRNLVPQWQQWQQSGAWRKAEKKCFEEHQGKLFRCDIEYNGNAGSSELARTQFRNGHYFVTWSDPRIPISFQIRVYNIDNYKFKNDFDAQTYSQLILKLNVMKPTYDSGKFDHSNMPKEDKGYYQDQVIADQTHQLFEGFEAKEKQTTPDLQKFVRTISFSSFLLHPKTKSELQEKLKQFEKGFTETEIQGLNTDRIHEKSLRGKISEGAKKRAMDRFELNYPAGQDTKKDRESLTEFAELSAREKRARSKK